MSVGNLLVIGAVAAITITACNAKFSPEPPKPVETSVSVESQLANPNSGKLICKHQVGRALDIDYGRWTKDSEWTATTIGDKVVVTVGFLTTYGVVKRTCVLRPMGGKGGGEWGIVSIR